MTGWNDGRLFLCFFFFFFGGGAGKAFFFLLRGGTYGDFRFLD